MGQHEPRRMTAEVGGAHGIPDPVRGGRPRDPSADREILKVATRILQIDGYRSLNIERVAEESGIAKTTIYRRYRDRQDLAAAAIGALLEAHGAHSTPDTGTAAGDLKIVFAALKSTDASSPLLSVLGAVMSEGQRDAALLESLWTRAFGPHHEAIAAILRRGIERGELRPDLDIATTVEIIVGALLARLIPGNSADDEWIGAVIDTVWAGMRAQVS